MSTVPVPRTATAGALATSAVANSWRDSAQYLLGATPGGGGGKRPMAILRQTIAQAVATATTTDLLFDTEDIDTDGGHSTITNTNVYTVQTAGTYFLNANVGFAANAVGDRSIWFHWNSGSSTIDFGRSQFFAPTAGTSLAYASISALFPGLSVGDTLAVRVSQNSGGSLNTDIGSGRQGARWSLLWIAP